MESISLSSKFAEFDELWSPRIVAFSNGQHVKLAKVKGEFVWHHHDRQDELFFVVRGRLRIELHDRVLELGAGELAVVPAGVDHRPTAAEETWLMLLEPADTLNTGNVRDERTVDHPEWI